MTEALPVSVGMSSPSRWMAVLRVCVGLWFLKAITSKMDFVLLGGFVPFIGVEPEWIVRMPDLVARQAAENPILWYRAFLEGTVLAHREFYAQLVAWGEVLVGLSLTLGCLAGLGALGGLWLTLNYGLATWHMSPAAKGFHYTLAVCLVVLFLARSGRAWGLDAWIGWRWPGSLLAKRPIS